MVNVISAVNHAIPVIIHDSSSIMIHFRSKAWQLTYLEALLYSSLTLKAFVAL